MDVTVDSAAPSEPPDGGIKRGAMRVVDPKSSACNRSDVKLWILHLGEKLERIQIDDESSQLPTTSLRLDVRRVRSSRRKMDSFTSWKQTIRAAGTLCILRSVTISCFFSSSGRHALSLFLVTELLTSAPSLVELNMDQVAVAADPEDMATCQDILMRRQDALLRCELLEAVSLSRLYFPCRLSGQQANHATLASDACAHLIKTILAACPSLKSLSIGASTRYFYQSPLEVGALGRILEHRTLQTVQFESLSLNASDPHTSAVQGSNVERLRLVDCTFDQEDVLLLLAKHGGIKALDLSGSKICAPSSSLGQVISLNPLLKEISLAYVCLGTSELQRHRALVRILRACSGHTELASLDLRGLHDYHYGDRTDDVERPVRLFREVLEELLVLLKENRGFTTVFLDELVHPSLSQPHAAVSLYQKLNSIGFLDAPLSASSQELLHLNQQELSYLFSMVRVDPLLCAGWNGDS